MAKMCLIITIVKMGWGDKVLETSMKAGAEGGTILQGRGVGVHEKNKRILGIPIEPEKDVVLSVVSDADSQGVLDEICEACELETPGAGIAFVVPVDRMRGVAHLLGKNEGGTGG